MLPNYVELSSCPPPFEVHPLPDNMAQVVFYYEAEQLPTIGDDDGERWSARYCTLKTRSSGSLAARIEAKYDDWFLMAKAQYGAEAAKDAREIRAALLSGTDYLMASDYPLDDESRAAVVTYRQALRDLPNTEGWPENIAWPEKPKVNSGDASGAD